MPQIFRNRAGNSVQQTFSQIAAARGPAHHFRMLGESGDIPDENTAIVAQEDLSPVRNLPGFSLNEIGPLVSAARGAFQLDSPILVANSVGSILVLYRNRANDAHIFQQANLAEDSYLRIYEETGPGSELHVEIQSSPGNNSRFTWPAYPVGSGDWRILYLNQSGAGVTGWSNEGDLGAPVVILNGTGAVTDWFDTVVSPTQTHLGARSTGAVEAIRGQLANVVFYNGALPVSVLDAMLVSLQQDIWGFASVLGVTTRYWFGRFDTIFNLGSQDDFEEGSMLPNVGNINDSSVAIVPGIDGIPRALRHGGSAYWETVLNDGPGSIGSSVSDTGTMIRCFRKGPQTQQANDTIAQENTFDGGYHGMRYNPGGQMVYEADRAQGFNDEDSRTYTTTNVDDSDFHMACLRKETVGVIPEFYLDGTLIDSGFVDDNLTNSLEAWIDSYSHKGSLGSRLNPQQHTFGGIDEHYMYFDGLVLSAVQIAQMNTLYERNRQDFADKSLDDIIMGSGANHYFDFTEALGGTYLDRGWGSRPSASPFRTVNWTAMQEEGVNFTKVVGPLPGTDAILFGASSRLIDTSASARGPSEDAAAGGIGCAFRTDGGLAGTGFLMSFGNLGGAFDMRMLLVADTLAMSIRNGVSGSEIRWDIDPPEVLNDDNWHFAFWGSDGTTWFVNIDGTWYDILSPELTRLATGTFDETSWASDVPYGGANPGRLALGAQSSSSITAGFQGALAIPMWWNRAIPIDFVQIDQINRKLGFLP